MRKILSLIIATILGLSQVATASTNVKAKDVTVDTSSFSGNLNGTDTSVQLALDTLDQVLGGSGGVNWGNIKGLLSNQVDLQAALNLKISGVNWGQIGGTLSSQTDLQTALNSKVATSTTVNGHALSGNVVVTASDIGLGNVQNVDTTIASNITSGILPNARLANIPNTAINWSSLNANVQGYGINWDSIVSSQMQSSGINWNSLNKSIQTFGVNWASLLNSEIQFQGINWASLNQTIQAIGVNWTSVNAKQIQSVGINWDSVNNIIQSASINWNSLNRVIQTLGINWQSLLNSEIQYQGINWQSLNAVIAEGAFNFSDITTANASISKHGLVPKLPNDSTLFYNGTGTFTAPPGSGTISSSTVGYYAQYTGSTTIGGIQYLQAGAINWTSVNALQIQANGINWSTLNQNIQALGINWTNLNKNIQASGVNWTSLLSSVQSTGINWTSLLANIQATGINWTSLNNSVQGTGINWASIVALIQTGNINWPSVKNLEIQSAGINWSSVIQAIQAGAVNWASVTAAQIQGSGINWTSVGNVTTGGTFTTNGFNANGSVAGKMTLYELPSNGNTYVALQAPNTVNTSVIWTLPAADAVGCFQSNGSGTVSIGTCGGGSGTVNSGTQYQLGYYAGTGSTISGNPNIVTDSSNDLTVGGSITSGGTGQSTFGYGIAVNSGGNTSVNGGDFIFKNSIGTTIFSIGASSGNLTIPVTGSIQCIHVSSTGLVSGTGSDCGAGGGGSPGGSTGNIQYNNFGSFGGLSQLASSYINWNNINLLAPINSGGLNWNNINSLALLNAGGVNWNSLVNSIQAGGVNWTSLLSQQIQHLGINWNSLNSDVKTTGLNWSNINAGGNINSGAFASITGSGNQVVLSSSPTITAPELIANVGIGSANPGTALDIVGTARMTGFVLPTSPTNNYVLTSDSSGNGTWQPASGTGTVTSVSVATANGFAGTVASATTTPAITIKTGITGILLGNGTSVSAATSGTDYAPATSGSSILKGNGSGGFSAASSGTDYAPATSGSSLLFGNGSGGFTNASSTANSSGNIGIGTTTNLGGILIAYGNVGVGSSTPGQAIDVIGSIRSSSSLISNGTGFTTFGSNVGIGSTAPSAPLVVVGHIHSHGTAPTAGTCGTSPSFGSLSTDTNGSITVGTGTTTTSCAVDFNGTWLNAPNCIVQDDTNPLVVSVATSTTVMTVTSLTTMSSVSVGDKLTWICVGKE